MGLKKFKPVTPGRRFMTVTTFEDLTKKEPEKRLLMPRPSSG
ncbi:MAG: 50S ribosomal protein L2, partial [Armatimonadetes bacterium]|nr:50S ribosomal protein L2 [Armatimonadota bacterium]